MSNKEVRDYLADILEAIRDIHTFVEGLDFVGFAADKKTINAVIRSLEVIGEAAKKIPPEIRHRYPALPWREVAGMRDKLIHEYFGIDLEIVWQTTQGDLGDLEQAVASIQETLTKE